MSNLPWWIIVSVSAVAWIVLVMFRGGFWRMRESLEMPVPGPHSHRTASWPDVAVIVPARNEASILPLTLPALLAQDYPGRLQLILVDDESEDGTSATAEGIAAGHASGDRLRVERGVRPPCGWRGKVWAMAQGFEAALRDRPAYVMFTDADIQHDPGVVRALVVRARTGNHDMVSIMACLRIEGLWDRLLVPAFVYFFVKLYPFRWVANARRRTAAAAGGCVLVRTETLQKAGGLEAIAPAVIDDCSLAKMLKTSGASLWLGFSDAVRSVRIYGTLRSSWDMVARSAYAQLHYSPCLLALTLVGMLWIYAVPPLFVIAGLFGRPAGPLRIPILATAAGAFALMVLSYLPILRRYRLSATYAATLPVAALLYSAMTFASAWRTWHGRETAWKDRPTTRL